MGKEWYYNGSMRRSSIDTSWMKRAACVNQDPTLFYPEERDSQLRREKAKEAVKICGRCAVREACLEYALNNNENFGIWGGETEVARRRLRSSLMIQ